MRCQKKYHPDVFLLLFDPDVCLSSPLKTVLKPDSKGIKISFENNALKSRAFEYGNILYKI